MPQAGQTYKTHTRFFPPYHFFVVPVLLVNLLYSLWAIWATPSLATLWTAIVAAALFVFSFVARVMALTVQDRVIRLEMRLRLMGILPPDLRERVHQLTREQCVALRFASDAELPDLVRSVLAGNLKTQKAIKERVTNWQGDYLRA